MEEIPNIPSFYRGQHVLVTGATGYLGKAVIEKLLRCCGDVAKITLILRHKRGKPPQKRLQEYLSDVVFERVKRENPGAIKKLEVVSGDLMSADLGLSPEDRQMLEDKVSVIFHAAASVRFDDPLKKALAVNTRGTLGIFKLVKKMSNLKVLVHISTTYCNCDKFEIDEVIYPAPSDWKMLLSAMEQEDDQIFKILTPKILDKLPNTYTFTKALAEHVVKDVAKDLPVVIFRPSVVMPAHEEPFPGWVDNFNGPIGLLAAGGLSLISYAYVDSSKKLNCVAVDQVTNALLVAAWEKAVLSKDSPLTVINAARSFGASESLDEMTNAFLRAVQEVPIGYSLWTNKKRTTSNFYRYYFNVVFFHFLLGLCLDWIFMRYLRISPVALYRKIHNANMTLSYFCLNEWDFKNQKMHWLRTTILPEDRKTFDFERFEDPTSLPYIKLYILGGRRFLLREHDYSIPDQVIHMKRLLWAIRIYYSILCLFLCWAAYRCYLLYIGSGQQRMHMDS